MSIPQLVKGGMTVQEIIELYPETMEVLSEWGLGCATCHIGAIETIEEGALAHGFTGAETEDLIAELNEIACEQKAEEVEGEKK